MIAANETLETSPPTNPFRSRGNYSAPAVEFMRALSDQRKQTGRTTSTPTEVLAVVRELGYQPSGPSSLPSDAETARFLSALTEYQQQHELSHPTCEDVLTVLKQLGYHRSLTEFPTMVDGLPIDRRRQEEDHREPKPERRTSLELSPQEQLELTDEEHAFLDALETLRNTSGREFASSEELLSIIWSLGYRPVNEEGLPVQWLNETQRCRTQMAFTQAVEQRLATQRDGEFLTCRSFLQITSALGFQKA